MANCLALRQYSRDGWIYSICRTCLAIIAVARKDAELSQPEEDHVCAPLDLAYSSGGLGMCPPQPHFHEPHYHRAPPVARWPGAAARHVRCW